MHNSRKKTNSTNTIAVISFLIGGFIGSILVSMIIFIADYSDITKKILIISCLVFVFIGLFQLITNKLRFKKLKGRIWGVSLLVLASLISMPLYINNLNNIILIGCNNDNTKAANIKNEIINGTDIDNTLDEVEKVIRNYKYVAFNEYAKNLEYIKINNLTYYYDNEDSKESIQIANNTLKEFYPIINKTFQKENIIDTDIVLLNDFNNISKIGSFVHGFLEPLTGKLYLLNKSTMDARSKFGTYNSQPIDSFESVVVHEYTHKLVQEVIDSNSISVTNIPRWFHEGIATYYENLYSKINMANTGKYIGDLKIDNNFDKANLKEYYESAAIVINYLISNFEEKIIIDIIEEMANTNDIYCAIKNTTGESFDEIISKVLR